MKLIVILVLMINNFIFAVVDNGDITHSGEGTYYFLPSNEVNCSYDINTIGTLYGAMNKTDYDNSASCGSFVHVTGPKGEVTIRIVDQCPECAPGDIDFSPDAFDLIADRVDGRVPISWNYVKQSNQEQIKYVAKKGCNRWWFAVLIDKHNTPIVNVEISINGAYNSLTRQDYNYWLITGDIGDGPEYIFRVTDIYGEQLIDTVNFNVSLNSDLQDYAYATGSTNFNLNSTSIKNRVIFSQPGYSLTVGPTPFTNNNAKIFYKTPLKSKKSEIIVYNTNNILIKTINLKVSNGIINLNKHVSNWKTGKYVFILKVDGVDRACFISFKTK